MSTSVHNQMPEKLHANSNITCNMREAVDLGKIHQFPWQVTARCLPQGRRKQVIDRSCFGLAFDGCNRVLFFFNSKVYNRCDTGVPGIGFKASSLLNEKRNSDGLTCVVCNLLGVTFAGNSLKVLLNVARLPLRIGVSLDRLQHQGRSRPGAKHATRVEAIATSFATARLRYLSDNAHPAMSQVPQGTSYLMKLSPHVHHFSHSMCSCSMQKGSCQL